MNKTGKGGFADRPEELRVEHARKGGQAKNPNKGFGSLSKEERSKKAKEAIKIRWDKYRLEKGE